MAKLTIDELKQSVKNIIGDKSDDDTLKFLEDFNDTISDVEGATVDSEWKKKYEALEKDKDELDKAWRKRYTDRFFSTDDSHTENNNKDTNPANNAHATTDEIDLEEEAKKTRFDDLFTPVKD